MKSNYLLLLVILFLLPLNIATSQELKVNFLSGESKSYQVSEIDSIKFTKCLEPASIQVQDSIVFPDMDCIKSSEIFTLEISNIGQKPLIISSIVLDRSIDFSIEMIAEEITIDSGNNYELEIECSPSDYDVISEDVLFIESNDEENPLKKVYLKGFKNSSSFNLTTKVIDLGMLCPDKKYDLSSNIKNTGNTLNSIEVKTDDAIEPITEKVELKIDQSKDFIFELTTSIEEGEFYSLIIFTDKCGNQDTATVLWNVFRPRLEAEPITIESVKYQENANSLKVTNPTDHDINLLELDFENEQFYADDLTLPIIIPANGSFEIPIIFRPTKAKSVRSTLTVNFDCDEELIVDLTGLTKIYLVNDDFEWYTTGAFPYSGGWDFLLHGDCEQELYVTDTESVSGDKSLRGFGNWGTDTSKTSHIHIEVVDPPDVIYCESYAMISNIGFAGVGLKNGADTWSSSYMNVTFSNHAHFFYGENSQIDRWPNDHYVPMEWYKIKFKVDFENNKIAIWMNDELVAQKSNWNMTTKTDVYYYLYTSGAYPGDASGYYDDVKIWYTAEF